MKRGRSLSFRHDYCVTHHPPYGDMLQVDRETSLMAMGLGVRLGRPAFTDLEQTGTIPLTQLGLILPNTMTLNKVITTLQHTIRHSPAFDIVDATGVGAPVVDMLRRADLPCRLMPVTITGGEHDAPVRGGYHVPKRELLTGLQVLVQSGGLERKLMLADALFRRWSG